MKRKIHFAVKQFTNRGGSVAWRVQGYLNNKQIRENFADKFAAVERAATLETERAHAEGLITLKPTSLTEVELADARSALRLLDGRASLVDVAVFYNRHFQPDVIADKSLADAYEEFISEKKSANLNRRQRTIYDLQSRVGRFVKANRQKMVYGISPADIRTAVYVAGWSPKTTYNMRKALHTFFEWAVLRSYTLANPVKKIDKPKLPPKKPAILTLDEVKRLLAASLAHKHGMLTPYMAISLFAGTRNGETLGLTWADIDLDGKTLDMDGEHSKGRSRRVVDELPDNLIQWLKPHQGKTPICPPDFEKEFRAVRRAAGFTKWTPHIMRHTCISYWLAQHKNENACAQRHGNSPTIIHQNYKAVIKKSADVAAYWALTTNNVLDAASAAPAGIDAAEQPAKAAR